MKEDIIDLEEVLERIQGDRKLLIELLNDFIKDFTRKRKQLVKYIKQEDFEDLKALAHSIKGSAGNVSVKPMANSFMIMEYLALKGEKDLLNEIMTDLDRQFQELQDFLKAYKKSH